MKNLPAIKQLIEDLTEIEKLSLWNDYQDEIGGDTWVREFDDDFFKIFFKSKMEAARATYFGKINNWSDKYVIFDGYGNLKTSNYLTDFIDINELCDFIYEHQEIEVFSELLDQLEDSVL